MQRPINRVEPAMPANAYKTYAIAQPAATHFRKATCAEVSCRGHLEGWKVIVDERTDLGMAQAYYIRRLAGRQFREDRNELGLTVFEFPPGQECFREHQMPTGRPALYLVGPGDFRTFTPRRAMRHNSPEAWRDDFGEHQERLAERLNRG